MMQKKFILFGSVLFSLLLFGGYLFFSIEEKPIHDLVQTNQTASQNENTEINYLLKSEETLDDTDLGKTLNSVNASKSKPSEDILMDYDDLSEDLADTEAMEYPDTIEGIKAHIYSKNIEYVEQIGLLDELVQTGDADVKEFWNNDWSSVDDWKKKTNGFKLEKNDNGDLVFSPDEQTARTYTFFENPQAYTYDEENKEFVNEIDFYGKAIYNVAKFINDDVLVMMTISGRKVDLNIYQKHAVQE